MIRHLGRRHAVQLTLAGLGGLATGNLGAAAIVTDPLPDRIKPSGKRVELVEFCVPPSTRGSAPRALLNHLHHAGDGTNRVFANDSRGKIWAIDRSTGSTRLFLDFQLWRGGAFLYRGNKQLGLRSFAFHPNFAKRGKAGYRRFYTMSTETVASRAAGVTVFGGAFPYHHDNVLAEWSISATDPTLVLRYSRREILRIAQPNFDHCTDQIVFHPGEPGIMYIGTGDGINTATGTDPYNVAQNPGCALGKILRINPLRHADGRRYRVPGDNPFVGRAGYLPEIWALGLRHPINLCVDGLTGSMLITDCGQGQVEEVNLGRRGANYGWPHREGTFATERSDERILYELPPDDAANGFTYPVAQYDHDEGNGEGRSAITGGFVYRGAAIPELVGHYILGDLVTGRIFHVPLADLRLGSQAPLTELTLLKDGSVVTLMGLSGVNDRVDLRFGQDELGELYVLTKQDGRIRRLGPAAPA